MRASGRWWRGGVAFVAVAAGLACADYLTGPQAGERPDPPVLVRATLQPDSIVIVTDSAVVDLVVEGRSRTGLDSVRAVLRSPSASERQSCTMTGPTDGTRGDGTWQCSLPFAPGSESGSWRIDSLGLFSTNDPQGSRVWTGMELEVAAAAPALEVVGTPPVPTAITISPDTIFLPTSASVGTFIATVLSQYGTAIPDAVISWQSVNPVVATVNSTGNVTPIGVGVTAIVASADSFSAEGIVVVPQTETLLAVDPVSLVFDGPGQSAQLVVTVLDQFGDTMSAPVSFESASPTVATVDTLGLVQAVAEGGTEIRVRVGVLEETVAVSVAGAPIDPVNQWVNAAGGAFDDPANWSRGAVPGTGDTAVVQLAGTYTIDISAAASIGILLVGGDSARPVLRITSDTLTVADSANFALGARLELVAGGLAGPGRIVVADTLRWLGGEMRGPGLTVIQSTGTALIEGATPKQLRDRFVRVEGAALWSAGTLHVSRFGVFVGSATSAVTMLSGTATALYPGDPNPGEFRSQGVVEFSGAAGTTTFGSQLILDASSHVRVRAGRVVRGGQVGDNSVLISGTLTVDADGIFEASAPAANRRGVRFQSMSRLEGTGTLRHVLGWMDVLGNLNIERLELDSDRIFVRSADTARVAKVRMVRGGISFLSGAPTTLQVSDSLTWTAGTVSGVGTLHALPAVRTLLDAVGSRAVVSQARLLVDGELILSNGSLSVQSGGLLEVSPAGMLELDGDRSIGAEIAINPASLPRVLIEGELVKSSGIGTATIFPALINRGRITVAAGTLTAGYSFAHEFGAVLRGSGFVDVRGALSTLLAGVIAPGTYPALLSGTPSVGFLGFRDNVSLEPTARLDIEVGGTSLATTDVVRAIGTLTAGGTLQLSGATGFVPAAGDTIPVLQYATRAGAFSAVTGLDFAVANGGPVLDTLWLADRLVLVAASDSGGGETPNLTGVLVFSSDRDGTRDIYLKDLATGAVRQVTNNALTNNGGRLSPDRTRLAYSDFQFSNNQPLQIVNADGTGNQVTVQTAFYGTSPSWSPDGTLLYFTNRISNIINVWEALASDPTQRRQVTTNTLAATGTFGAKVSPDGTRVVFAEASDRIVTVRVSDGGDRRVLYEGGAASSVDPDWSPDGTAIVFTGTTATGASEVRVVNAATSVIRTVVSFGTDEGFAASASWSPDGTYIVFARNILTGLEYEIWAVRADGTGAPFLVEDLPGWDYPSHWVQSVPFSIP